MRVVWKLLLVGFLLASLVVGPSAASSDITQNRPTPTQQLQSDTLRITQIYQLTPDDAGSITATFDPEFGDDAQDFGIYLPKNKVIDSAGFKRRDETITRRGTELRYYDYDGANVNPFLKYRFAANYTDGPRRFVDTGKWAIVSSPAVVVGTENIDVERHTEVAGSGIGGESIAYLGEYESRTASAQEEKFKLIIPDAADLTESPQAILDDLIYASENLHINERNKKVTVIAHPYNKNINNKSEGGFVPRGGSTMVVSDKSKITTNYNVWIHEYVHTRQNFDSTENFSWFTEGSAYYYQHLLTLQQEQIGFREFKNGMNVKTAYDVALTEGDFSRTASPDYTKGARVAGHIDRKIRLASNGNSSLIDVFRQVNAAEGPVSNEQFIRYVRQASNDEVASYAQNATTTSKSFEVWSRSQHEQAFNQDLSGSPEVQTDESDGLIVQALVILFFIIAGGTGLVLISIPVILGLVIYRRIQ